jgi:hypothetical protein
MCAEITGNTSSTNEGVQMKVFIVMEIGWEYNDENYYRTEDEGGVPKVAYESRTDAYVACAEMNVRRLASPSGKGMKKECDTRYGDEPIVEFFEVREVELYCE